MRSLDEFYKYVEKQEQELRTRSEVTPVESPQDAPPPPAPAEAAPVESPENKPGAPPRTPTRAKPSAEGFVPPPLPPKAALPSRYERIVPAEALRPNGSPEQAPPENGVLSRQAPPENGVLPRRNGHTRPAAPPAGVRYVMRGGVTIPVSLEAGQMMPDIEAYIPALRDPAPPEHEPSPAPAPPEARPSEPSPLPDAPARPRRIRRAPPAPDLSDGEAAALWGRLPRHIQLLVGMAEPQEEVAQKYYTRGFKESRRQLIERLLDPTLSLEDTARVLGVCPTTVRRYTNRGLLPHHRTVGQQRRFRLSDVLGFLEQRSARGVGAKGIGRGAGA